MDVSTISKTLRKANVWHKVENDFIYTRRTSTKIPDINAEIAYLAGIIAGDGCLTITRRKKGGYHYRVNVTGSKDELEGISRLFEKLFKHKPKVVRDKRKQNCYSVNVQNAAVFAYFQGLGFSAGKKRGLHVPHIIAGNSQLFRYYMLGLTDADGHMRKGMVQLKQRDEDFLNEIVQLLKTHFGLEPNPPRVNLTKGRPYYYIRFSNRL